MAALRTLWNFIRKNPAPCLVSLTAFLLFTAISIVNHYHFRTYSFDLGLFNQAMFDYRQFRFSDTGTFTYNNDNFLADHFDLYLMLFSPISYLLGSSTLLWIQLGFLIFGAWGVYRLIQLKNKDLALAAMIGFLSFYGIYTALAFDYHSNVVAAACLPWFLLRLYQRKYWAALAWFIWILAGKETMSLWLGVISVCLLWEFRKDKQTRYWLFIFWGMACLWFVSINGFLLPALNSNGYAHFKYQVLGETPLEALKTLLTKPHVAFQHFLHNHNGAVDGHGIKEETQRLLLISGLWLLLFRPAYLGMLVPIFFMKFFHNEPKTWSICYHYSIEFAPVISIGAFSALAALPQAKLRISAAWLLVGGIITATVLSMTDTHYYCGGERHRFYTADHWKVPYNVKAMREGLSKVPKDAIVSASPALVPRLAFRNKIYCYPIVKDAEYVVFALALPPYPLSWEENITHCTQFYHDPAWELAFVNQEIRMFKRVASKP